MRNTNILETIRMIEEQKLDIRTVTMGISLLDCADSDGEVARRKIYDKITSRAANLVSVCEMDWSFDDLGKVKVEKALRLYRDCLESGDWPGIPAEVHQISAPAYYLDSDKD